MSTVTPKWLKVSLGYFAAGVFLFVFVFVLPHYGSKYDWSNEKFTAVCDDRGGKVMELYDTACVKMLSETSFVVLLYKDDWLEKRNG